MNKDKPLPKRIMRVLNALKREGAIVLSLRQSVSKDETKALPKKTVEKMIREGLLVASHTDLFGDRDFSQTFVAGETDEFC